MVGDAGQSDSYEIQEGPSDNPNSSGQRDIYEIQEGSSENPNSSEPNTHLSRQHSRRRQSYVAAQRSRPRSDEEVLGETVADAGLNAFGCVFVEIWVIALDGTKLSRPGGGHWMDPAFAQSLPTEAMIETAWKVDREAEDCPPGVGIAGTLADEVGAVGSKRVHWRQIRALMNDPFVQRGSGKRMEKLFGVGIGLVACVPFSFEEEKGIVLYYSRSSANADMLRATHNERFLIGSTDLIGANYAIRRARDHSAELRKNMFKEAIKKVRKELLHEKMSLSSMVMNTENLEKLRKEKAAQDAEANSNSFGAQAPSFNSFVELFRKVRKAGVWGLKRINYSRRKWRGTRLHGPPRQSFYDCLFCFIGVYITMLAILKFAKSLNSSNKFEFDAGWWTSTLCIVYALTPAPVGQPRQIVAAHLWNMIVGLLCREIPTGGFGDFEEWGQVSPDERSGMPLIWVQALAVALGVSGQAYIGIIHPPATGLSMTFASKPQFTWSTMASVMVTDCIVVGIAMMYLNLSQKKQYPLYWLGLGWEGSGGSFGAIRGVTRSARRKTIDTREVVLSASHETSESIRKSTNDVTETVKRGTHIASTAVRKRVKGEEAV